MAEKRVFSKTMSICALSVLSLSIIGCGASQNSQTSPAGIGDKNQPPLKISLSIDSNGIQYVISNPDINSDPYVKQVDQLTNTQLNIQIMPHGTPDFGNKMDLLMASGNIPDVVEVNGGYGVDKGNGVAITSAIEAGQFLPLNDLIAKYAPDLKQKIPQDAWNTETYTDGKIYAIPDFITNPVRRATIIRMDLLKKANLPVPKTVADTLNVLRAFKKMGVEEPFVGRSQFQFADTFFGSFNTFPTLSQWVVDAQGQPVPSFFNSPNMEQAIQTYKTMYDEGLIHQEFLTDDKNAYNKAIFSGNSGMWTMNASDMLMYQSQIRQNVPDAQLAIIPSPVGPDGKGGYPLVQSVVRAFMINKNVKDPGRIIQFLDWMLSPEAEKFFTYGVEGQDYTMDNGKINYKQPQTSNDLLKESARVNWLWLIHDETYIKGLLELTPDGQNLMKSFDTILTNEGRDGIRWTQPLDTINSYPDLQDKFILGHIAKMVTGSESIDSWPSVIDDWKKRGGDKILAQAADFYKNNKYLPSRRK